MKEFAARLGVAAEEVRHQGEHIAGMTVAPEKKPWAGGRHACALFPSPRRGGVRGGVMLSSGRTTAWPPPPQPSPRGGGSRRERVPRGGSRRKNISWQPLREARQFGNQHHRPIGAADMRVLARPVEERHGNRPSGALADQLLEAGRVFRRVVASLADGGVDHAFAKLAERLAQPRREARQLGEQSDRVVARKGAVSQVHAHDAGLAKGATGGDDRGSELRRRRLRWGSGREQAVRRSGGP